MTPRTVVMAVFYRELMAQRLSRFLQAHLVFAAIAGALPLLADGQVVTSAPWWMLQAVLYGLSLSSMLLGLSSAQSEREEWAMIFSQPMARWAWLTGKVAAIAIILMPAAFLLVLPTALVSGLTARLAAVMCASGGATLVMALVGLALGCAIRDGVRGVLACLSLWFVLLFGVDLLSLGVASLSVSRQWPALFVAPMMLNPLDSLRVAFLFALEQAAPPALDTQGLSAWWMRHSVAWGVAIVLIWLSVAFAGALVTLRREVEA